MFERITADDVQPGDYIARAKTHPFFRVASIDEGPVSRRFHYADTGGNDRPRRVAKWWRLTGPPAAQVLERRVVKVGPNWAEDGSERSRGHFATTEAAEAWLAEATWLRHGRVVPA